MDANTLTQIVTVALAVLAIIWHQQRSTDKLRGDFERAIDKLRDGVAGNGERLSRIEGFLGVGMPAAAAPEAPGAGWKHDPPNTGEQD